MTDEQVIAALCDLDDDEDAEVSDRDADLLETAVRYKRSNVKTLSAKQRAWALAILARHGRD